MKLPTYDEAADARDRGQMNPLEKFIYENEPAGKGSDLRFRNQLRAAIDFAFETLTQERAEQSQNSDSNI